MAINIFHWLGKVSTDPGVPSNWEGGAVPSGTNVSIVFDQNSQRGIQGALSTPIKYLIVESGFEYGVGVEGTPFDVVGPITRADIKAGVNFIRPNISTSFLEVWMYGDTQTVFENSSIDTLRAGGSLHLNADNPSFTGVVTLKDSAAVTFIETGMDVSGTVLVEPHTSFFSGVTSIQMRGRGATIICNRGVGTCEINDAPEGYTNTFYYEQTSSTDTFYLTPSLDLTLHSPSRNRAKFYHNFNQHVSNLVMVGGEMSFEDHNSYHALNIESAILSNEALLNLRNNNHNITATSIKLTTSDCSVLVDDDARLTVSPPA